jgi:hypothetical protein
MGMSRRRALVRVAPYVALGALLAAFFAPLAQAGRAFVFRDLVVYAAGQDALLREAILERHELPATNPYAYLGVAHLADPATGSLYPLRLATALVFEPPRSLGIFIVLHFAIAAAGAYRLGRALGAARAASAAGAAVYALSGPVLSLAENLPLLAGAAWLPFCAAFALEATRRGPLRTRKLALAAASIALAVLGGDLQGATWAMLLVGGVVVVRVWARTSSRGERTRGLVGALATPLLGLGIAGVLLVPAAHLRSRTDRRDALPEEVAGSWSLAPARAAELVVPFPFGLSFPEGETIAAGLDPAGARAGVTEPWTESLHAGLGALVLGLAGLASRRRRTAAAALAALAGAGYVLALGPFAPWAPWRLLRAIVPFYDVFRYPEKHTVLIALGLSGLASLGLDALRAEEPRRRAVAWLGAAASALAFGFLVLRGPFGHALRGIAEAAFAAAGRRAQAADVAAAIGRALDWEVLRGCVTLGALALGLVLFRKKPRLALAVTASIVAADVAIALRPRLFLGDASLYAERPLGAEIVHRAGGRLLRWPWASAAPIGRVPPAEEEPGRRRRERAIAARVLSWTGNVAARERVPAVQGFSSFVPLVVRDALPPGRFPDPVTLDGMAVRWLVLDERLASSQGLAPVLSSSTGVVLIDRGGRVPEPPPPTVGGPIPGFELGLALSALSIAGWIALLRLRPRR